MMRLFIMTALAVGLSAGLMAQKAKEKKGKKGKPNTEQKQKKTMNNEIDSLSYALGISIANNIKSQGIDEISADLFKRGLKDVYSGGDTLMDVNQANEIINTYFQGAVKRKSEVSKKIGADFLAENGKKDGVSTTASGLQYKVVKMGTGPKPSINDKVTTHYHGTLINGKVFDSSVERNQPASFPVGGVIKGWQEALQLMPVGSKFILYVPYDLAYGDRGAGPSIGPYETLIFEVELLSID
jgi:FKBP-type peptidyl-prolyl cis-trans isomerase FklB